jgi:hypothetical protein
MNGDPAAAGSYGSIAMRPVNGYALRFGLAG